MIELFGYVRNNTIHTNIKYYFMNTYRIIYWWKNVMSRTCLKISKGGSIDRTRLTVNWSLLKLDAGLIILFYFVYIWKFHNKD